MDEVIVVPEQLCDPEAHRKALTLPRHGEPGNHPCPVEGCRISAEEHHRISFGYMTELRLLRRDVQGREQDVARRVWDSTMKLAGDCGCEHDTACSFQKAENPYGDEMKL